MENDETLDGLRQELRRGVISLAELSLLFQPQYGYSLVSMLEQAGFAVVGPAATVDQALGLIAAEGCDAAILDFLLRDGSCAPVAEMLRRLEKPFLVLSGVVDQVPADFTDCKVLSKPIRADVLLAAIRNCFPPVDPTAVGA